MADYQANKRLKKLIEEHYKMSPFAFSQAYGDNGGVKTSAIMRERNGISNKMLDEIIAAYPEINRSWILTGEGERIRPASVTQHGRTNINAAGSSAASVIGEIHGDYHQNRDKDSLLEVHGKRVDTIAELLLEQLKESNALHSKRYEYLDESRNYIVQLFKEQQTQDNEKLKRMDALIDMLRTTMEAQNQQRASDREFFMQVIEIIKQKN